MSSNGFGGRTRNIATNTAKAEASAARYQINMISEIKITTKCNTKITCSRCRCDIMITDWCREETNKFASLSGFTNNNQICIVCIEPESIVCQLAGYIIETVT